MMRLSGNRLDGIPPANVPFRFFLTAPWFAILAALALLAYGPETWSTTRNPGLIGIVHLLTLGFVTMTMVGALFQLLPVLGGESIPAARPVAFIAHLFLVTGTLCLFAALGLRVVFLFMIALPALAVAVGSLGVAIGSRLLALRGGDSIHALRLAVFSLLVAAGLGIYLALGYLFPSVFNPDLTAFHMAWALLGWVLLLVMGVSFQVIPMFQITPEFPAWLTRVAPVIVFTGLLLAGLVPSSFVTNILAIILGLAILVYAGFGLHLLQRRKRRVPDVTVLFWQLGLSSLGLAVLVFWVVLPVPAAGEPGTVHHKAGLLAGVLAITGFAGSIIMGMLQKIVPFLAYLHLQRRCAGNIDAIGHLPHMHAIIRPAHSRRLLYLHGTAVAALAGAVIYPPLTRLAAFILLLDFGWLAYLLSRAMWIYAKTWRRLEVTVN